MSGLYCDVIYWLVCVCVCVCVCLCVCVFVCSMDGFRVVKLEDVIPHLDILITATGQHWSLVAIYK